MGQLTLQLSDSLDDDNSAIVRINDVVTATEGSIPDSGTTLGLFAIALGAIGGSALLSRKVRKNRSAVSLGS